MLKPKPHPIAEVIPRMQPAEVAELARDIGANGLIHPIVLFEGKVLDGRHRLEACAKAGVKPRFVDWEGEGSPVEWVKSVNLERRHLTPSQRALAAAAFLPLLEKEAKKRQREHGKTAPGRKSLSAPGRGVLSGKAAKTAAVPGASSRSGSGWSGCAARSRPMRTEGAPWPG